ncbi:MAG TPA: glycosyltransferase, partial [Flavobacteriaceae bacterium]|nr:glycosyltransferase [Flavobacteriaceae bacterium]
LKIVRKRIKKPYLLANLFSGKETHQISSWNITETKSQSALQKFLLYIRDNFFIPDTGILWKDPSVRFLKKNIAKKNIDTIITTGPPHSLHLIGLKLKYKTGVNWIADFRDPWTGMWDFNQLKLNQTTKKKHNRLEKQVLRNADQIITTSKATELAFKNLSIQPIKTITNGYDDVSRTNSVELDKEFSIAHIGSFFSVKPLKTLWQAYSELIQEHPEFKNRFRLRLVGKNNSDMLRSLTKYKLIDFTEDMGDLPHEEMLSIQESSQVLLLQYTHEKVKGVLPDSLFEYLRFGRPILALGPDGWDAKKIIEDTQSGYSFNFDEKEAIKSKLLQLFEGYKQKDLKMKPINIEKYHRRNLTKELSQLIKNV